VVTYEYYCPFCQQSVEVEKPSKEAGSEEKCPICYYPLERLYSKPFVKGDTTVVEQ